MIIGDTDFKEDAVREEIVHPLLVRLGYASSSDARIVRSRSLAHPFVMIGTTRRPIRLVPDYLLCVEGKFAWVLDAKAPGQNIMTGEHVEQAFSYAIHPEVRAAIFALCNGRQLTVFQVEERTPVLSFSLEHLETNWRALHALLSPAAFKKEAPLVKPLPPPTASYDYLTVHPPSAVLHFNKQAAKRHHGVHGYFTRQVWSVVQKYVETFSQPGDTVLDPYGGTGVTFLEAIILGRRAIHIDLNPLSKFIVETLVTPVDVNELAATFSAVIQSFEEFRPNSIHDVHKALKRYWYPKEVRLPTNSDVALLEEVFSPRQLSELSLLLHLIQRVDNMACRSHLLLMFSGLLNKINLTYHASKGRSAGRGDSAIFRYYRYRMAPSSPELDIVTTFKSRFKKILAAKEELRPLLRADCLANSKILRGSATSLNMIPSESVDYIYTDPPYGSKIPYLDLSVMWNAWLKFTVSEKDYELEAIEGGEKKKSKGQYASLVAASIQEMYRVLKFGRWMSFVFSHKDPAYWHMIVGAAEASGFEYAGVVQQNNGQTSFKKRQMPFTVLSGQLIINFKKTRNPRSIMGVQLGLDVADVIDETVEATIAVNHGATIEQINDALVIRGMELGFLHILSQQYQDLTPILTSRFDRNPDDGKFYVRKNAKFRTHVDVRLRIRYFLLSYLRQMARLGRAATFDEIVLEIMPLLKNGVTPENQTILSVLEAVAERVGESNWHLRADGQTNLPL